MLDRLLPVVFQAASQRVDSVIRREGDAGEGRGDEYVQSLEDKGNALSMLVSFCHDLQVGFFPYVEQTAAITLPLLRFPLSSDIRSYATTLMPLLVTSAVTAYKAGRCDLQYVRALMSHITAALLQRFKEEEETDLLDALVRACKECVVAVRDCHIARDCVDADGLSVIADALLRMLQGSRERIRQRERRMEEEEEDEEGMDEDSMVTMEAAIYEEDALHITIADCIGTLIQSHQHSFLPTWRRLQSELLDLLRGPGASVSSRRVAVFLFDDLVEYGGVAEGQEVEHLFAAFLPHLISYVALYPPPTTPPPPTPPSRQDGSLRQACAYGLGVCAAHHPAAFLPYVEPALAALLSVIDDLPARLAEDAQGSTTDVDNAISALGKVAGMEVGGREPYAGLWGRWVYALPLREDEEEGLWVYGQLVRLVEGGVGGGGAGGGVMGDEGCRLHVLWVLSVVVNSRFVDEELNARIQALLQRMKRDIARVGGEGGVNATLKGMTSEQRQKVVEVLEAM